MMVVYVYVRLIWVVRENALQNIYIYIYIYILFNGLAV
jgi:hypothetical protein